MNADIALIHLKTDIVFNGTIIFACLFNYNFNFLIKYCASFEIYVKLKI
jgi:hypothetical protein